MKIAYNKMHKPKVKKVTIAKGGKNMKKWVTRLTSDEGEFYWRRKIEEITTEKTWVYMHEGVISKIQEIDKAEIMQDEDDNLIIVLKEPIHEKVTRIVIQYEPTEIWHRVEEIGTQKRPIDPEEIHFIKMSTNKSKKQLKIS